MMNGSAFMNQPTVLPSINRKPGIFKLRKRNVTQPTIPSKLPAPPTAAAKCPSILEDSLSLKDKKAQPMHNFTKRFSLEPSSKGLNNTEAKPRVSMLNKWKRRKSSVFIGPERSPLKSSDLSGSEQTELETDKRGIESNKIKMAFQEFRRRSSVFSQSSKKPNTVLFDKTSKNVPRSAEHGWSPASAISVCQTRRNHNNLSDPDTMHTVNHRSVFKPSQRPSTLEKKLILTKCVDPSLSTNGTIFPANERVAARPVMAVQSAECGDFLQSSNKISCSVRPFQGCSKEQDFPSMDIECSGSLSSSEDTFDSTRDTNHTSRSLQKPSTGFQSNCRIQAACTLFNKEPEEGVQYMISRAIVRDTPCSIANYLFNQPGLNRQAIGEYFGSIRDDKPIEVLREYLNLVDMSGLEVDEAVRAMLSHFHPAGESQKISHLMHIFQEIYISKNPDKIPATYRHKETVEVLAYSILMLHTDLHNPNVKRLGNRMSEEAFLTNNRGIDGGEDLPPLVLKGIYRRVAEKEFKTFPDPMEHLRRLDALMVEPLKTEGLVQRHRRFSGWVAAQELDEIPTRPTTCRRRWRHVLIFNDMLMIVKPVTSTTSSGSVSQWSSVDCADSVQQAETDKVRCYSTEPIHRGLYHHRLTLPTDGIRILVFETQHCRYGVRFCDKTGPVINLLLPSSQARRQLVEWTHESLAEINELHSYQCEKNR